MLQENIADSMHAIKLTYQLNKHIPLATQNQCNGNLIDMLRYVVRINL